MMRTYRKGYSAPWSDRRETVGLLGTFLVFLIGFPGHSELLLDQTRHLLQQLIQLSLVFLGLVTPVSPLHKPGRLPSWHQIHKGLPSASTFTLAPMVLPQPPVEPNFMAIHTAPFLHHMNYIFQGTATFHGQICRNASVLIRLISGERTVTQGTVTNPDGTYYVQVAIDAQDSDPVDWTIHAYTPDFHQVEIAGRRIVQDEEDQEKTPIVVNNPVEFVLSLSK